MEKHLAHTYTVTFKQPVDHTEDEFHNVANALLNDPVVRPTLERIDAWCLADPNVERVAWLPGKAPEGRTNIIELNDNELITVLYALRNLQYDMRKLGFECPVNLEPEHFKDEVHPLNINEIDALCARINTSTKE